MSRAKQFLNQNVVLTAPIFYILLAIAVKERHGYDIMKQVENDSRGKIRLGAGTLYGAIKRMLEDKLIVGTQTIHARRKYYKLTEKGRSMFLNELKRYDQAVDLAKKKNLFVALIAEKLSFVYA